MAGSAMYPGVVRPLMLYGDAVAATRGMVRYAARRLHSEVASRIARKVIGGATRGVRAGAGLGCRAGGLGQRRTPEPRHGWLSAMAPTAGARRTPTG